jgi:hypothetical protein
MKLEFYDNSKTVLPLRGVFARHGWQLWLDNERWLERWATYVEPAINLYLTLIPLFLPLAQRAVMTMTLRVLE